MSDTFKLVVLQNILHDVNEIFVVFRHDSLKKLTLLDVDSINIKKRYILDHHMISQSTLCSLLCLRS